MKKLVACLLLLLLALPATAEAASTVMEQARRASLPESTARIYLYTDNFMERYYLGKPSFRVNGFLQILNQNRMLEDYPQTAGPVAAFMSVLFKDSPNYALEWLTPPPPPKRRKNQLTQPPARYSDEMLKMLQHAVWLSGRSGEENIARLFAKQPDYLSKPPVPLVEAPVLKEGDLDALWGAFIASGDTKYVGRIVDTACGKDAALARLAAETLGDNAKRHEYVARTLRYKKTACGSIPPLIPQPLNLGQMDGEFSANLLLADYKKSTSLMDGPVDAVMQLPAVDKIRPRGKISVIIAFSGMEMRDDLSTDLNFDFVLIGPNGKPVENSQIDKRKISPVKRPGRYVMYHPNAFLSLFFKEGYPAGTYTVKVTMRDNVGGKKIDLQRQVEFVKDAP